MSDRFKHKKEGRKPREYETKTPRANSYLIVAEGEKTEPLYFSGLVKVIKKNIGGNMEVIEAPLVDINGEGRSTLDLVYETERIVSRAKIIYQNVWVVFDKDAFDDFDEAVALAEEKGYKVAWSNECFEYWLYLHFDYSDRPYTRFQWFKELNHLFRVLDLGNGRYRKNYKNLYKMLDSQDGINIAIKNAKRRMAKFDPERQLPSEYNPGTMVHLLVEELRSYIIE